MSQHKWHKEIKAWADGAEIEYDRGDGIWLKPKNPIWHDDVKYRIKPQPKEPQYLYVYQNDNNYDPWFDKKLHPKHNCIGKIKMEEV